MTLWYNVMMAESKQKQQKKIMVKTGTFLGSVYSQIVGVTVTDTDITLEFVYKHPRAEITEAQVVSRITLPRAAGEDLAKAILDTVRLHESRKKGEKNG